MSGGLHDLDRRLPNLAIDFGLPVHCDMEPFKAPLAEVAAHIETDMLHLVS
jgi:hypothetical protein